MSYVTRTFNQRGTVQMVNLDCVRKAIERINFTNIQVTNNQISFTSKENRTFVGQRLKNGVISFSTTVASEASKLSDMIKQIESEYKVVLAEYEAELERLRQEKLKLERELSKLNSESSVAEKQADTKAAMKIQQLNEELTRNQNSLASAQEKIDEIEQSKRDFVQITKTEIISRGENSGWSVAKNYVDSNRNVTRLQLRKKQLN